MEVAKPKYVWWDIDCCQVPRDRDPKEVRWIIESALKKKFGPGPVTIFAIGNLNRIARRVLDLVSRAGIFLKHTTRGGMSIMDDLLEWTDDHPPPAILMVISDREEEYEDLELPEADGYTILRTYVNQKPYSPSYASDVWLWKTLLTTTDSTTRQQELHGTGGWYCIICRIGGKSFTGFTSHCKTRQHLKLESYTVVETTQSSHVDSVFVPFGPYVPLDSLKNKPEPEARQGPMLRYLTESCNNHKKKRSRPSVEVPASTHEFSTATGMSLNLIKS